jgi:hypothetical protein
MAKVRNVQIVGDQITFELIPNDLDELKIVKGSGKLPENKEDRKSIIKFFKAMEI